jgi:hypothetical protein
MMSAFSETLFSGVIERRESQKNSAFFFGNYKKSLALHSISP